LIVDGRLQSDIRQGVTFEVMDEGTSMGPLSDAMKVNNTRGILGNKDIDYEIDWTTLGEYLEALERRGVSCNVTSFVGTGTLRRYVIGGDDRDPTPAELDIMRALVRQAMEDGAVGMSAALIYPPVSYAKTEEIIELAKVVAEYDGLYISHLRSEGAAFFEALDEIMTISRSAGVRAEIYHLKAAGRPNWDKLDEAIRRIEAARADGLPLMADMYMYRVSGTGLDACLPPWAHDGGERALLTRLKDPETRARIKADMNTPSTTWETMWLNVGSPERIILAGLNVAPLKRLQDAIRRLTSFPASTWHIRARGSLTPGYFADVVAYDPAAIQDHATYVQPHQYATGMQHVFVNGVQVLAHGEHTGAKSGRVVRRV